MEKKVYALNVDPELRDLIPPLTEEEHQMLEDSIVRDGCDTPLVVWNGTIVDGHNRYEICQRRGIPFAYEEMDFKNREAAMIWAIERQLARRNLNSYQRSVLALKFEPLYRKQAAINRRWASKGRLPKDRKNVIESHIKTRDELGKIAGVSHDTISKVSYIEKEADAETKRKLMNGEISIHRAFSGLSAKGSATQECLSAKRVSPFQGINMVVLADQLPGEELSLRNSNITVVLTDEPTYQKIMGLLSQKER